MFEPWRTLPPIVPERAFPAIVGAGDQIFLWGGWVPEHADGSQPPFDSGLILDADRAAWREVAPSPLRGGGASATWTGSTVLVLSQGEVAEYSPANDTWATISGRAPQEQPLVTIEGRVYFPRAGFVWDVGTRQWIDDIALLPTDSWGTPPWDSVGVLAAERSLVAIISEPEAHHVWTYDTTAVAGWAEIATLPTDGSTPPVTSVWRNELVVMSWTALRPQAVDLVTGEARELPTFPAFATKCLASTAVVGDVLVIDLCGAMAALAPGAEQWRLVGPSTGQFDTGFARLVPTSAGFMRGEWEAVDDPTHRWFDAPWPTRVVGLSISPELRPVVASVVAWSPERPSTSGVLTFRLEATNCAATIRLNDGAGDGQRTMGAAMAEATPEVAIEWWSTMGSYSLSCPDSEAFQTSFASLRTVGELSRALDVTDEVVARVADLSGPWEGVTDRIGAAYEAEWGGFDPDDPTSYSFGSAVTDDDSAVGVEYRLAIVAGSEPDTWRIVRATRAWVCARGVDASGTCV